MFDIIDRAEAIIGIKKGLESMARGEGVPAEEAFEQLRKKHHIPRDEVMPTDPAADNED